MGRLAGTAVALALVAGLGAAAPPQSKNVFLSSPVYAVDLSLTMTGKCAPSEGSDFKQLDLYSGFQNLRFVASPVASHPAWIQAGGGTSNPAPASHEVSGKGEIRGFDLCQAWEDETHSIPAKVTGGPSPFRATLTVLTANEAKERLANPADPITPVDLVRVVWLEFSTRFSILGQELAWEHPGLSKSGIGNYSFVFSAPLDALGKGQSFSFTLPHAGEGERGTWSVMFNAVSTR
jgi:hypothetical protein